MWVSVPITAHAWIPHGATEGACTQVEAAWERASRRWGAARVGVVVSGTGRGARQGLDALPKIQRERSPAFAIMGAERSGAHALQWAESVLQQRRLDAVVAVAQDDAQGFAMLVLERQAEAALEFLGVREMSADAEVLRAQPAPDWTWGDPPQGLARAAAFVADRRCSAGLLLRVGVVLERLSGRPLEAHHPLLTADPDAHVAWAVEGEWVVPVRARP